MHSNQTAAWLLLFVMFAGFSGVSAVADEKAPEPNPKPAPAEKEGEDIWNEFSFASEEELQLTEKQVQEMLEQLKKTNPKRAAQLEALQKKDSEKFIAAIRDEIRKHKKPTPEQPKQEKWKEELFKKHEAFLVWFKEQYPQDHKELMELQIEDPEKYVQRFMDLMKIYEPIQKMERYNQKLADTMKKNLELQKRRDALLLQIRIASKDQQPKLVEDLRSVVSQRFDSIVLEKQLQYEWLRRRLEGLTEKVEASAKELESLNKNKERSVQDRVKELMERTEKVNWD